MIIRTYKRRNKGNGHSLNETSFLNEDRGCKKDLNSQVSWNSSQESHWSSSQEAGFFSSQDSSSWSQASEPHSLGTKKSIAYSHGHASELYTVQSEPVYEIDEHEPPLQKLPRSQSMRCFRGSSGTEYSIGSSLIVGKEHAGGEESYGFSDVLTKDKSITTSTLMEAQESGEMMEHVDEANFAMDGLRAGQPLTVQRASLSSILNIAGSLQCRRLLKSNGLAKSLLGAMVALPMDDPPLALAAAAILYFFASDGKHEDLLDSPTYIRFLLKLLSLDKAKPSSRSGICTGNRLSSLSSKFLVQRTSSVEKGTDHGGAAVIAKVTAIFSKIKAKEFGYKEDYNFMADEMNAKWFALLTLEKACLSTVVLEDNARSVPSFGGEFKERLRELGGLDAICIVAANSLANLCELNNQGLGGTNDASAQKHVGDIGMLLRCFRVMENVTFLSEENQNYLLELDVMKVGPSTPDNFIALIISTIKWLHEFTQKEKSCSRQITHDSLGILGSDHHGMMIKRASAYRKYSGGKRGIFSAASNGKEVILRKALQKVQALGSSQKAPCMTMYKHTTETSLDAEQEGADFIELRRSNEPDNPGKPQRKYKMSLLRENTPQCSQETYSQVDTEFSQDPFAFDEVDIEAKVENISKKPVKKKRKIPTDGSSDQYGSCRSEVSEDVENLRAVQQVQKDVDQGIEEGHITILLECLLSAVKVLMNLTNDNAAGCRQVASCGGLSVISSLIVSHYPWEKNVEMDEEDDVDILVAVLGVLVNLVEKDRRNRAQLSALDIALPAKILGSEQPQNQNKGMISVLCSLFLSKKGAGETAASRDEQYWEINDETCMKQGQREAENMIVEAYAALLLGFLSKESQTVSQAIAELLPGEGLLALVPVLERFLAFHLSLNMITAETHNAVKDVIDSCKHSS